MQVGKRQLFDHPPRRLKFRIRLVRKPSRFGSFLEALEYGTPPHGGIAPGLDRIVMIPAGAESLPEGIPFPKTGPRGRSDVRRPTPVSERRLRELGIALKK